MPGTAHAPGDTDTTGFEQVLVELAIGRYGSRTVPAYRSSGDALLPVLQLAELTEALARPVAGGAIELLISPDPSPVVLDPARWEIRTPHSTLDAPPP